MNYLDVLAEVLKRLKPLVKETTKNRSDFENIWTTVTTDFAEWLQSPSGMVSLLDGKIILIRRLVNAFNNDSIRTNKAIIDVVVSGTQMGGEDFKVTKSTGIISYPIIDRYITKRGGIMLTLKDERGKLFKWEYFD
jgi:hypothetical protein